MDFEPRTLMVVGALLTGAVLGATIQRSGYCMMGAVADYAISGNLGRLRAWMLTIAVAIAGCQALHLAGLVDLSATFYRSATLPWMGLALGGMMFGFGMVIACGCASRSLVNFATGDLRALVALLFMAVFGYATMRGLLAFPRLWLQGSTALDLGGIGLTGQGVPEMLAGGAPAGRFHTLVAAVLVIAALLAFVFSDRGFLRERSRFAAALIIGACVTAGWWITAVLGADAFEPTDPVSLRFVAPVADSLQYLMTWTGSRADFGVASVGGVLMGAFASAAQRGELVLRAFEDRYDLARYMSGGALMGVGGVLAMGCTVGQGLTGVATLSLGSFLALGSIIGGGILGVRYLEQGTLIAAMRATLGRA